MRQQPEMSSVLQWLSDLLVGQMEAILEGQDINVRISLNKLQNKIITWSDSLANDYTHQPIDKELDQISF